MTPFLRAAITTMLPQGDPDAGCHECGFPWTVDGATALDHVRGAEDRFSALLQHAEGSASASGVASSGVRHDPAVWSPSGYVWHVGDLIRAWAERLHALATDPAASWAGFDPDDLARARRYDALPAVSAAWAVGRAADALLAVLESVDLDASFDHPEWGPGTVADALRWVAHEVVHHDLDVRRGLGLASHD